MKFDFSKVKNTKELLPEGQYEATITKWEQKQNKAKDGDNLWITFNIATESGEQEFSDIFSLKETAIWKLKNFFVVLGLVQDKPETEEESKPEIDLDEIIGATVLINMIIDKYKGNDVNKAKSYEPVAF